MKIVERAFEIDPATMTGGMGEEFESPAPRSSGVHLSNVIRDLENRILKPGERRPYEQLTPQEKARMGKYTEMGFIWEVVVERVWKSRMRSRRKAGLEEGAVRQPEIEFDGVFMSPDAFVRGRRRPGAWSLDEYKATWLSSRHPVDGPKFWAWFRQMMGYCWGAQATLDLPLTEADLFVFYVNGDYRESGPQAKHFEITFSEREMGENWRMLTRHAAAMGRAK